MKIIDEMNVVFKLENIKRNLNVSSKLEEILQTLLIKETVTKKLI